MDENENSEGRTISNIVKEYPDMIKIVIYHNSYFLPKNTGTNSTLKKIQEQTKKEDNLQRSLRRTKTTIQDIMASNQFDLWCTFTYNCRNCKPKCTNNPCTCSSDNCKRFDVNYTRRTLQNWFKNQKKHSPNLKYLAVPEFHKNGAVHFHCMISNFNGKLKDSGRRTKNQQTIYNATGYYSGFTEFVKIGERFDTKTFNDDYNRVISYLTKYITKDMPMIYGKKRFLVSQNLNRPTTTVNGVSKFKLNKLIYKHKPVFINEYLEVQKHKKTGVLSSDFNSSLISMP